MHIEVTQYDIDHGSVGSCYRCPVAIAVKRHTHARWVTVTPEEIDIEGESYTTPREVARFIRHFDKRSAKKPFTFELSKPS